MNSELSTIEKPNETTTEVKEKSKGLFQKYPYQPYIFLSLFIIGAFIAYYPFVKHLLANILLSDYITVIIGLLIALLSYLRIFRINKEFKNDKQLIDVDNERLKSGFQSTSIISGDVVSFDLTTENKSSPIALSFIDYFQKTISYLEDKSTDSDKKASLLLDNGKRFSVAGIVFFILATIIWQFFISIAGEFKIQHIYGIISTSLVFIFIEFISAWYLRQYKSFSDTSTYLTKIKSIFDKYMLIYLVSSEKGDKDFTILLEQLSSEIKWPETYLLKNADVSFAKDALETMTTMAQAFKSEVKNQNN